MWSKQPRSTGRHDDVNGSRDKLHSHRGVTNEIAIRLDGEPPARGDANLVTALGKAQIRCTPRAPREEVRRGPSQVDERSNPHNTYIQSAIVGPYVFSPANGRVACRPEVDHCDLRRTCAQRCSVDGLGTSSREDQLQRIIRADWDP